MKHLLRIGWCAALLVAAYTTVLNASNGRLAHVPSPTKATGLIIDEGVVQIVPDAYMTAASVEVTLRSESGTIGVRQTTPGTAVAFSLPSGVRKLTVETKYSTTAGYIIIIEVVDR